MPAVHETAYPRLKSSVTSKDLADAYTPTEEEMKLAGRIAKGRTPRLRFLVLLKTFQHLGYFVQLKDVPLSVIDHIRSFLGISCTRFNAASYDNSGTRRRHIQIIRQHSGVNPFNAEAMAIMSGAFHEAAHSKEDLADLINFGIEELIRCRYELPGFSTLVDEARRVRTEVNRDFYRTVNAGIGEDGRNMIDQLFAVDEKNRRSLWNAMKDDPGKPTLTHLQQLVAQIKRLSPFDIGSEALSLLPEVKVAHFAAEARSLDVSRMQEMEPSKRYTLSAAFIKTKLSQCLDDLGEMFIRRMRKIHQKGKEALDEYRARHQNRTDQLISILHHLVTLIEKEGSPEEKLSQMQALLKDQPDRIRESCEEYIAYSDNNYYSFLWRYYRSHRKILFALLDHLVFVATSRDKSLENAITFVMRHRSNKGESLPVAESGATLDLSWIPDKWWKLVAGTSNRNNMPGHVDRRQFEVCLFSQIMLELKSGDLCIAGSNNFADYRRQLISWEEYERDIASYCEQVGFSANPADFVIETRRWLEKTSRAIDAGFPKNNSVRIVNGEPVLTKIERNSPSPQVKILEQKISERIHQIGILDALSDTEAWLNWSQVFG